jgi:uncharacterized membrane-anchored protein YhcB (DUF1043 family)
MTLDPMLLALVALTLVGLGIGVLVGRHGTAGAERARALQAELDAQRAELERVQGEKLAINAELEKARHEAEGYRTRVVEHFYGTSEQLRSLTLRYRELFEHLAEGARELCPEASNALQAGLDLPALGEGSDLAEPALEADTADLEADTADEEPAEEESLASEASKAPGQTPS